MKALLELLERDASLTPQQMAVMLNLPVEEVEQKLAKLIEDKVIVKHQAVINWEKAGVSTVTAMIEVKITPQRELGFDALAERIYRFPEVHTLYLMSGAYDLLVIVKEKTLKEVADFVATRLSTIEGVVSTTTHFMLKKYKESGTIMEDHEEDRRLVVTP